MDEIKDVLQYYLTGEIDFKGQELADKLITFVCYAGVAASVILGYVLNDIEYTGIGIIATYAISLVFCLPIPAYRRNPEVFLNHNYDASSTEKKPLDAQ